MKFFVALFFIFCFPFFIFLTTVLYTTDITPLLKTDLVKNHMYSQLSNQLGKLDTGDSNSAVISQFIQNKFTSDYIQGKVETAMDSSDDWIRGKTTAPPVISFRDVKNELNAQYPQLLPDIQQAAQKMKEEEAQNPQLVQQNPQAAKNIDMIASLAKSDFTIPLTSYLAGLKNFYTTVRILQPVLAVLLILSLIMLGVMNKTWPIRLTWIGGTLLFGSIWGFVLAFGNAALVTLLAKYAGTVSNHTMQIAAPIMLQLIRHYIDAFTANQKLASIVGLIAAVGSFICIPIIRNKTVAPTKTKKSVKKQ